jgi:hypothetical protein
VAADHAELQVVMAYNHGWLVVFLISVLVIVAVSVMGITTTTLRKAPELGYYVSSLLKDNPYMKGPVGGSGLAAGDRARLLKGVKMRYGDVAGEEDTEHISIASSEGAGYPAGLRKGRPYR